MKESWWQEYRLQIIVGGIGLALIGAGIYLLYQEQTEAPTLEIIPAEEQRQDKNIVVDIEGAVEKPGVYKLTSGARLDDLLVIAGGLSAEADREWAEKNLNKAIVLADGAKFYLPAKGEQQVAGVSKAVSSTQTNLINLNVATLSELDTLTGIGTARAQAIIDGRPYQLPDELVTRKIITQNVFDKIKDQITVY